MKIIDYIVKGGENLTEPAIKTPSFPHRAEALFDFWHKLLGKDDAEPDNYLELPFDSRYRLYIKSFWVEKNGNRPICYYVGLLLSKDSFIAVGEYYRINKGLANIKLNTILEAQRTLSSIPVTTDWPLLTTAIWTSYADLRMTLCGEEDYDANIRKMCSVISINNIDDWFGRLFIAVNPYRLHSSYYLIVSRKTPRSGLQKLEPQPPQGEDTIHPPASKPISKTTQSFVRPALPKNKIPTITLAALLISSVVLNIIQYANRSNIRPKDYYKVEAERDNLKSTNEKLEKNCSDLVKKKIKFENIVEQLRTEKQILERKVKELEASSNKNKEQQKHSSHTGMQGVNLK